MSGFDPDLAGSPRGPEPPWIKRVALAILIWVMLIITALVAAGIDALLEV